MKPYYSIFTLVIIIITYSCHGNQPDEKKSLVNLDSLVNKKPVKSDTPAKKTITRILRDSSIQNISVGKGFSIKVINYTKPAYDQYMEIEGPVRKFGGK